MKCFRNRILGGLLALAMVIGPLALTSHVLAQTILNSTTTTAAVTGGPGISAQQIIALTSVTGIATNDVLWIDGEAMVVTDTPDTTALTARVRRGALGTSARSHISGAAVWTGPPRRFSKTDQMGGSCTRTAEEFLPRIVVETANLYDCLSGEWVRLVEGGYRTSRTGRGDGGTTYTVAGALTVQPGVTFIGSGGALAMTLANPTYTQNGMVMMIYASTAQAHTVTYTAGFGGGTTARDVATFGGAINDGMTIIAFNQVWWVLNTRNVTIA